MANTPLPVRVVPMTAKDPAFHDEHHEYTAEQVQREFFLRDLPAGEGEYLFPKVGLQADRGTVVLFQYKSAIIASATLLKVGKPSEPQEGYNGAFYFDVDSIRVFKPVGADVMRKIWPEFKKFAKARLKLNPAFYPAFERQLTDVRWAISPGGSSATE